MGRKNFPRSLPAPARYKDGHTIEKNGQGHILEYCPEHPACNKRGMVPQHRLVMECHLGRFLTGVEVVHHRDKNKKNNSIENLELFVDHKAHMRHHQKKRAKKYDPKIIEMVRKAAENPLLSYAAVPLAGDTIRKICLENNIHWISPGQLEFDVDHVYKVLSEHQRKEAVKILGVNLQTLWNRYPELMRKTANRKLLKWGE